MKVQCLLTVSAISTWKLHLPRRGGVEVPCGATYRGLWKLPSITPVQIPIWTANQMTIPQYSLHKAWRWPHWAVISVEQAAATWCDPSDKAATVSIIERKQKFPNTCRPWNLCVRTHVWEVWFLYVKWLNYKSHEPHKSDCTPAPWVRLGTDLWRGRRRGRCGLFTLPPGTYTQRSLEEVGCMGQGATTRLQ